MTTNLIHERILQLLDGDDPLIKEIVLEAIKIAQSKPLSAETLASEFQRNMKSIIKEVK